MLLVVRCGNRGRRTLSSLGFGSFKRRCRSSPTSCGPTTAKEHLETEALGWTGRDVYVRMTDPRYRLTSVWLRAEDVRALGVGLPFRGGGAAGLDDQDDVAVHAIRRSHTYVIRWFPADSAAWRCRARGRQRMTGLGSYGRWWCPCPTEGTGAPPAALVSCCWIWPGRRLWTRRSDPRP
jgi:hypothetical protein